MIKTRKVCTPRVYYTIICDRILYIYYIIAILGWQWDRNVNLLVKDSFDKRACNWSKANSDAYVLFKRVTTGSNKSLAVEDLKAWSSEVEDIQSINALLSQAGFPSVDSTLPLMSHVTTGFVKYSDCLVFVYGCLLKKNSRPVIHCENYYCSGRTG